MRLQSWARMVGKKAHHLEAEESSWSSQLQFDLGSTWTHEPFSCFFYRPHCSAVYLQYHIVYLHSPTLCSPAFSFNFFDCNVAIFLRELYADPDASVYGCRNLHIFSRLDAAASLVSATW